MFYLKQRQSVAEEGTKGPGAVEGRVRGDGDSGDAHDDVRH